MPRTALDNFMTEDQWLQRWYQFSTIMSDLCQLYAFCNNHLCPVFDVSPLHYITLQSFRVA